MRHEANQWIDTHVEEPVVGAIRGGGSVYVDSYPIYSNRNSTVPTAVEYFTSGSVQMECVIKNNPTTAGSHRRHGVW